MPIYEYECHKCGKSFEKLVSKKDEKIICENCGSVKVDKLLSRFAPSVKEGGGSAGTSCCPTGSCCPDGMCNL